MIIDHIQDAIGTTPVLRLDPQKTGLKNIDFYAKLDFLNPFGSLKDRVAKGMLEPHLEDLKENNKTVIEASSGNTAKALAAICNTHDIKFKLYTNRVKLPEIRMILQVMGADIEELPSLSDCPDPMDNNSFFAVADATAKTEPDKYLYTDQIFNPLNMESHYRTTAQEIYDAIGEFDYYINFLGTCGSSTGVLKFAHDNFAEKPKAFAVVASPGHYAPGGRNMNELWETNFFDRDMFDDFLHGTGRDAVDGILALVRDFGVLGGPTAGLQYFAGLKRLKEEDEKLEGTGERKKAVFIICDRVEPYLTYIKKYAPEIFSTSTSSRPRIEALDVDTIENNPVIEPDKLSEFLEQNDVITVDIRGNFAFNMAHIPNSVNILDELFGQLIEEGPIFDKSKKILVACGIGSISKKYAAFLRTQGYDAFSLEGGINACKRVGFEMASNKKQQDDSTGVARGTTAQIEEKGMLTLSGFKKRTQNRNAA